MRVYSLFSSLLLVALIAACGGTKVKTPPQRPDTTQTENFQEPQWRIDGSLAFIDGERRDTIRVVDIEIADTPEAREQGLMWRRSVPDSLAMLFIFDEAEEQSFWMRNTYVPLDMIYVGADLRIVSIHRNTIPLNEEGSYPSGEPAQFVVEVRGGYCDAYGIAEGDRIIFRNNKQ